MCQCPAVASSYKVEETALILQITDQFGLARLPFPTILHPLYQCQYFLYIFLLNIDFQIHVWNDCLIIL